MYHFKKDVYNPLIIFSKGLAKWIFSSGSNTEPMKHFSGTTSVSRRVSDLFFGFEDLDPYSVASNHSRSPSWRNFALRALGCEILSPFFRFTTASCAVQMCSLLPAPPNPQAGEWWPSSDPGSPCCCLCDLKKLLPFCSNFPFPHGVIVFSAFGVRFMT